MRPPLTAHVVYVTPDVESPDPVGFLLATLSEPLAIAMIGAGAFTALLALLAWLRFRPQWQPWSRFVARAWSYRDLVPWMLRLSFGLVLIGAGLSGTVFAPQIGIGGWPHVLQTALGFLLLLGFAVRLAAIVGLASFFVAVALDPQLVVIFDVAGGLAAIALLGPARPSLDDLLRAAFPRGPGGEVSTRAIPPQRYDDVVPLLVRLGLGGALLASGIVDKLLVYERGLLTVEQYGLTRVVPVSPELWVVGAALIESSLGLAIVLGLATRLSAMVAFAVLTLTLFALPDDPAIAHVGLFGSCSILVVLGAGRWSVDAWLGSAPPGESERFAQDARTGDGQQGLPDLVGGRDVHAFHLDQRVDRHLQLTSRLIPPPGEPQAPVTPDDGAPSTVGNDERVAGWPAQHGW